MGVHLVSMTRLARSAAVAVAVALAMVLGVCDARAADEQVVAAGEGRAALASAADPAMLYPGLRADGVYRPERLAFGDFNGDGNPDAAFVTRTGTSRVHVLLGRGDGAFPELLEDVADAFVTNAIYSVEVGQFITGGPPELAIIHSGGITVARWQNNKTFQSSWTSPGVGGSSIEDTATGDIDGDGKLDIVAVNGQHGEVLYATFGDGAGRFEDRTFQSNNNLFGARFVELADMDGDGLLDIVVGGMLFDRVWLMVSDGERGFESRYWDAEIPTFDGLGVGDFDNDGDQDIVTADEDGQIAVLFNTGTGELASRTVYDVSPGADHVSAGDLNHDGWADLIMSRSTEVDVFMNQGDGTLGEPETLVVGNRANETYAVDVNGDAAQDLVMVNRFEDSLTVLLNGGDGSFGVRDSVFAGSGFDVLLEDLDGDGDLDAATPVSSSSDMRVFMNRGNGTFASAVLYDDAGSGAIASGDFDGDGDQDLVFGSSGSPNAALFENDGAGVFERLGRREIPGGVLGLASQDVDNDGRPDLVAITGSRHFCVRLGMGDMSFGEALLYPTSDSAHHFEMGDLNADGILDAVVAARGVQVRFGWGDGTFGPRVDYTESIDVEQVALGDVDGDGHTDAVTSDGTADSGQVLVYINDGTGFFLPPSSIPTAYEPEALALVDADLDGDLDIFAVDYQHDAVGLSMNFGGGLFLYWVDLAGTVDPRALAIGDVDGDGDPDLAVRGTSRMEVLHNRTLEPPVCSADMDGDGLLDLDDVDAFVVAFLAGDLAADLDGNGVLTVDDIEVFVSAFIDGCEA